MSQQRQTKRSNGQQPLGPPPQSQIKRIDSLTRVSASSPAKLNPDSSGLPIWLTGGAAVLLVLFVGSVIVSIVTPSVSTDSVSKASEIGGGVVAFASPVADHRDSAISYKEVPPIGGVHNLIWQNCSVYDQPVKNENAVHSLEHGAVWITYQPALPSTEVDKLRIISRKSNYRLLSPFPGLPSPIVASAWGYQLKLDKADDPRLSSFIQKYEQKGPEPGAACSNGQGQPLGLAEGIPVTTPYG